MPPTRRAPIPADPAHSGWDPLFHAIHDSDPAKIADALARGASPNAWTSRRGPALVQAMAPLSPAALSCCKLLLTLGAHPDHGIHCAPVTDAILHNRREMFTLLLEFGANPNLRGALLPELGDHSVCKSNPTRSIPEPPLAAALRDPFWVEGLLGAGADPNACLRDGSIAHRLCSREHPSPRSAELLVFAGADLTALDSRGHTPIEAALREGRPDLAAAFEKAALALASKDTPRSAPIARL